MSLAAPRPYRFCQIPLHRWLLLLLLAGLFATSSRAAAAPPDPPPPSVFEPPPMGQGAAALVTYARSLFAGERYSEAAQVLLTAYDQSPQPVYLFNAAQSFRKATRPQEALDAYQRFLIVAPDDPLAVEARGYALDMQTLLAAQSRSQTVNLALESERQVSAERQQALLDEKLRLTKVQAELERAKHPPFYKRAIFWGIVSPLLLIGIVTAIAVPVSGYYTRQGNITDGGSFTVALP
jgi:tetratricopeptide (TPR) repeat protein